MSSHQDNVVGEKLEAVRHKMQENEKPIVLLYQHQTKQAYTKISTFTHDR